MNMATKGQRVAWIGGSSRGAVSSRLSVTMSVPRRARFWIEMIAVVSAAAFVLAMLIAVLGAATGELQPSQVQAPQAQPKQTGSAASAADDAQSYEGVITDSHCGAKHSAAIGKSAADCTRMCVHGGEQFVLVVGDELYVLEGDPAALKQAAGRRVRLSGTLKGKKISVTSIVAV